MSRLPTEQQRQQVNAYLHSLPDAEPPLALRQRVLSTAPTPRSGSVRAVAWAALLVAVGLSTAALFGERDERAGALTTVPLTHSNPATQMHLRALDRELQRALQDGAGQSQVAALWAERAAVVAQLDSPTPAVPVRL